MRRREFLALTALTAAQAWAAAPPDLTLTRAVAVDLPTRRAKFVGKNAIRDDHGDRSGDRVVRLYTNQGVEGLGACVASKEQVAQLLGKNPLAGSRVENREMGGPLGSQTMPLWDLAGRLLQKPVHALLAKSAARRDVPVYDGSIYLTDLLPQHAHRWQDRFKEEIDAGLNAGHRAFKIKIGRGRRWMEKAAGDARDAAVVELIRRHVGNAVALGVDANDAYDLEQTQRFLDRTADVRFEFVEEPFPETVESCLALKRFMADRGWKTLLADGESQVNLETYRPFIEAKAIDVFQADMNRFGIEGILREAAMAEPQGLRVAPHNWGSLLGFYAQVQLGAAIGNFFRAEQDPLASDVLRAPGYRIENGLCRVSDAPGFGLELDEERFSRLPVAWELRL